MSFAGYGIILFDPRRNPIDLTEISTDFTLEFFVAKFHERWSSGTISHTSYFPNSLIWTIPTLDSGDDQNPFTGRLTYADMGISFGLTPHETISTFLLWFRSIVPSGDKVYFLRVSEFWVLEVDRNTDTEEIQNFLVSSHV